MSTDLSDQGPIDGVAIVGMAARLPGARSVAEFWRNQLNGIEAISHFNVEELEIQDAAVNASDPRYVRARSVLEDADLFDAEFFGLYPREAELMDPQQRLFLECCWQAIEDAGYDPETYPGQIGVQAGCSMGSYFLSRLCAKPGFIQQFTAGYQVSNYPEMMGNSLDFLSTRVSYKLNLRGPSFTVLSACSTSLLAVTQACQSLLTYQCDMTLAGGVSITFPQKRGYYHQEGGMVSPDGHCRAFDADAQGTVFGSGVGVVLLKRLEDAVRDGDQIYAVIRGFGVNNDGSSKVGYTAPSVEGQARVIAMAHQAAEVQPDSIGYIEAHGTGTPLGDPIELAGLSQAFRAETSKKQFCTIGTAKTNIGHLDIAAGVAGLINAVNIVRHGVFPPTLHFRKSNPNFDLEASPFKICTTPTEWRSDGTPRRAGVSAFGVGGTNAHVVIEQAPDRPETRSERSRHLLVLSARSTSALDRASENLAAHLKEHPEADLADVAWTLQNGRRAFACRRFVIASDASEAIAALSDPGPKRALTRSQPTEPPAISFLFPGQGSQHPNMARELYGSEPAFRHALDQCAEILRPHLDTDLRALLYPAEDVTDDLKRRVTDTVVAQPAIFSIEYALAKLWMSWGIRPQAMAGHSIGEFVAACLAGVFSLEDALALVATRGRMMQGVPAGGMLSVRMTDAEVRKRLPTSLSLAAVNSPSLCVVAGPFEALDVFESELGREGVACRRLVTSHAFHSAMMDPLTGPFEEIFSRVNLNPPNIPYLSGVTGTWIKDEEATSAKYWARHAREPVHFSAAIAELRKSPNAALLEVGPGNVLATLARQHGGLAAGQIIVSSLSDGFSGEGDGRSLMNALGSLWRAGVQPDWPALYSGERRRRVSLPTYPFERKRYALDIPAEAAPAPAQATPAADPRSGQAVTSFNPVQEHVSVTSMPSVPVPATSEAVASSRPARIRAALAEIIEGLSGQDLSTVDGSTTFLEMGFDSLFLTQVTQALHETLNLKVTFRQLLGDQSSLDALTAFALDNLPPDAFAEPAQPAPSIAVFSAGSQALSQPAIPSASPAVVLAAPNSAAESPVERLMREQLQAMNVLFTSQLAALGGSVPVLAKAVVPPAPVAIQPVVTSPAVQSSTGSVTSGLADPHKPFGPYKPPQTGVSVELLERQQKHLDALIEDYCGRTARSKRMTQDHRKVLADPRVVSGFRSQWKEMVYPIVTDRSEGSRLWDLDGNEYIDLVNGFGPIMLGHRPRFVEEAIEAQLRAGFETGPQSPLAGEVARMFCEMTGNERMTFCNTGSEAVLAAMRVARTVTGRNKIAMFAGDYHGISDEVLVKGFKNKSGAHQSAPIAPGIPRESVANMVVLDYATPESLDWIRQNANTLAAVLVEPVQSRHPDLQPVDFLKDLRKITEESGTALIFDEVVTGFRVHPGGCQALFGIRADLATYGKVIAGGVPIGVLAGKSKFMDALDGGMWQYGDDSYPEVGVTFFAGTFVRHPLALAATKAVLRHFKEKGPALQQQLNSQTSQLVGELKEFIASQGIPARIESFGSFFYLSFPSEERFASLFYFYMRYKGIHIREGFPCFLTTAHSHSDVAKIVQAFKYSALEMQTAGFFNQPGTTAGAPTVAPPSDAPMTEAQLEVWLADQLSHEASCSFNESVSLRLVGPIDESVLKRALKTVVGRHDALRSSFSLDGDQQHFAPAIDLEILTVDLSTEEVTERNARLKSIIAEDASKRFLLSEGHLVRAQIVKMGAEDHRLLFTAHHIVCDGWSINVLFGELAKTYNAIKLEKPNTLSVPMSFTAYARSQAQFAKSAEGEKTEAYWLDQFKEPVAQLDLPLDRPRPPVKNFSGTTYYTKFDADFYSRIKKMAAANKSTLFVALYAAFNILLSRLSGQDDIVVGIPTAGQSLLEDDILVGHCVNFIPLRSRLTRDVSAAKYLAELKETVLAGYEHQNYTYGRLVRKLAPHREPGRLPLTEVQFNLERVGERLGFDGAQAELDPNPKSFVNFDIFLNIRESKDGLALDCDYNSTLFDESTIARWLDHYRTLLEGMVSDATCPISRLPLLSAAEQQEILFDWNNTRTEYPRDRSVASLFEEQAARTPDATAVIFAETKVTYRELNARANQIAHYLRLLDIGEKRTVAFCLERSVELIVAALGILKADAAYVPIDPTLPRDRLQFLLDDTGARVMLTQSALVNRGLKNLNLTLLTLDDQASPICQQSDVNPKSDAGPDSVAYVMYTSGSTGRPKGVMIENRSIVRLVRDTNYCTFGPEEVFLQFAPASFDASTLEIWGPLLNGGSLVLMPPHNPSLEDIGRMIRTHGVTSLWLTAGLFHVMVDQHLDDLRLLRQLLAGGDVLAPGHVRQVIEGAPQLRVVNGYGPTEGTTFSCCYAFTPGATVTDPVPIGRPISNTRAYVLDENLQAVPVGVTGELFIAGDGLARAYLNSPELTAQKFFDWKLPNGSIERLYRTGDRVRLLADGNIQFLGRADNQIKLRGYRVELDEIEAVMRNHPNVRQGCVVPERQGAVVNRLIAYVVPTSGKGFDETTLREHLRSQLPQYMLPAVIVTLDALPLNPNGKVDRARLPSPEFTIGANARNFVAPTTPQEKLLSEIVAEVLSLPRVGVTDNFFELGADSLRIFQITSRANKAGLVVTPRQMLQHRTIQAVLADADKENASSSALAPIRRVARERYRVAAEG